jgi:hypothetical protein
LVVVACDDPGPSALSSANAVSTGGSSDSSSSKKPAPKTSKPPAAATNAGDLGSGDDDDDDDDNAAPSHGQHHGDPAASGVTVTAVVPLSATVRAADTSSALTITVSGTGFDASAVVVFDGNDMATKLLSPTSLQATVPNASLAAAKMVLVAVRHAGAVSTSKPFTILAQGATLCGANNYTCTDLGLNPGQCGLVGKDAVQCLDDGCIYESCT